MHDKYPQAAIHRQLYMYTAATQAHGNAHCILHPPTQHGAQTAFRAGLPTKYRALEHQLSGQYGGISAVRHVRCTLTCDFTPPNPHTQEGSTQKAPQCTTGAAQTVLVMTAHHTNNCWLILPRSFQHHFWFSGSESLPCNKHTSR